jgi:hypothetical protein
MDQIKYKARSLKSKFELKKKKVQKKRSQNTWSMTRKRHSVEPGPL